MKPSELAITIACLPGSHSNRDGWMSADNVRDRLALLGFKCSPQQVAAWLGRMARTDAPWVERDPEPWYGGPAHYRVTVFGRTDIRNKLPLLDAHMPWVPTYRGRLPAGSA